MNTLSANTVTSDLTVSGNTTVSSNLTVSGNVQVGTANLFVDTVSSNVGVGTNAPMGTLDVKGVLNHTQVANVAQITSNSNVVMEYRRSKKLIKYPRVALTQNDESGTSGYVASANSEYPTGTDYNAFRAFNNWGPSKAYVGGAGWESANETTFGSDGMWDAGAPTSSSDDTTMTLEEGNTIYGEWLQIQLPTKIRLEYVNFSPLSLYGGTYDLLGVHRSPRAGYILGSNNGTNWTTLKQWSGLDFDTWVIYEHTFYKFDIDKMVDNYQYFRFVWTETASGSGSTYSRYASCQELEFWGVPEYDPEAHGTDMVLHTTPNVPNTDFSNVYYDGQDYTSMPATVADKSGNGVTGTPSGGVGFDSTYKAFTFDGVDDKITATLTNPAGDWVHSVSMWWRQDSVPSTGWNYIYQIGAITTNAGVLFAFHSDGFLAASSYASDQVRYDFVPVIGKWYHFSVVYKGGNYNQQSIDIYIDGSNVGGYDNDTSNISLSLGANTTLTLGAATGGTSLVHGSMANFRIYNRALSGDEIWELYAYQKEYFGVSPDVVTLKAGRVGIGTSEPRAVLDVRGESYVDEMSCGGVLKIGTAGRDYGTSQDQGNPHYGRKNLFIHSTFEGTATEDYGWWIGAQHQTLTSTDNDLYFIVVRNGVENAAAYISDSHSQVEMNFTGQHRTFIKNVPFSQAGELEGLIVSSDQNKYIKMSGGIETGSNAITTNESLPVVSLSNVVSDKKCFGVISASEDPKQRSDAFGNFVTPYKKENGDTRVYINSVGEGAIWVVNTNGPLEAGDYITTSNVVGYGQKQDGAGLMNYTVAKITMDCDFNPATQPIQIIEKSGDGENVLDEHGQIQWEDHTTETEKAYKIRYIDASGVQTDEANAVHTAAFVGCTYHCG